MKKLLILALALIPVQSFACEPTPSAEFILRKMDKGRKGYVTEKDYNNSDEKYFTFENADENKDKRLTLAEIQKSLAGFGASCPPLGAK